MDLELLKQELNHCGKSINPDYAFEFYDKLVEDYGHRERKGHIRYVVRILSGMETSVNDYE